MKTTNKRPAHLIDEGKDNWERTDEFKKKVNEIKREVSDKHQRLLLAEKNWFRRLLIKIRIWVETKKRIDEVSSSRNLHFAAR